LPSRTPSAPPLTLELILPGLVPEAADAWTAALGQLPALRKLLARARRHTLACEHLPALLLERFEVKAQEDWPAAPFCLLGDEADPGEHIWLRADPVHLLPQQSSLVLAGGGRLRLRAQECTALLTDLNRHLEPAGLALSAPRPVRWYLRVPRPLRVRTTPTEAAQGRSVDPLLPQGDDALLVHGWINEIQMLLHDHAVNTARTDSGALPVNSVWLWGAGRLVAPPAPAPGSVWTQDALLRGLARAADLPLHAAPVDADDWLARAGAGEHVILLPEAATEPPDSGGMEWRGHVERWERSWLDPLLAALSAGRLRKLTLATHHGEQALRYTVAPGDLWKVWRQRIELAAAAPGRMGPD
jgi:hypothetical protein